MDFEDLSRKGRQERNWYECRLNVICERKDTSICEKKKLRTEKNIVTHSIVHTHRFFQKFIDDF